MAKRLPICHKMSRLFHPTNSVPVGAEVKNNDLLSKSHKLMVDEGIIAPAHNGFFYLLPLAVKALDKLARLVDDRMMSIGAQKIFCPTLTHSDTWKKTDRLALAGPELFQLNDRHNKNFILSPTHEESITQMLASLPPLSHKQLPLLLYQMTPKFRDEMKPRFGLIRAREFLMKDLYSFDTSPEAAQASYDVIDQVYNLLFETIGVNFVKVKGSCGMMGGTVSHEFHFPAPIGDDSLRLCEGCGHGWNQDTEAEDKEAERGRCPQCGGSHIMDTKGIEVGHMFLLGNRYSTALQAMYSSPSGQVPLVMGSYGLGLTRILAASLEVLSSPEQLRWPPILAPYSLAIITPKEGSKESATTQHLPEELYWRLQEVPELVDNVIIDDRSHLSIGKRLQKVRRAGYPHALVVGKMAGNSSPQIELLDLYSGKTSLHRPEDIVTAVVDSSPQFRISVSN